MKEVADFKADMHHVYICACKDPEQKWSTLPFIGIDEAIFAILDTWPLKWHGPDAVGRDEVTIQKQKAEAKRLVQ